MGSDAGHGGRPWLRPLLAEGDAGGGDAQARAVGVAAGAQSAARLGVDLRVVGNGEADLAFGDVAFRGGAGDGARGVVLCLDVLLAHRLLLQQVTDLHDVPDDLHWTRQRLLPRREVLFDLLQVRGGSPAFVPQMSEK